MPKQTAQHPLTLLKAPVLVSPQVEQNGSSYCIYMGQSQIKLNTDSIEIISPKIILNGYEVNINTNN